jgi:membrane-bound serine protease (ClpP class)
VAGGIALILMLYMASILPVNIAAVALVILALALFAIDAFAPTHGILTVGGAVAFLLGGLMMFDRTDPQLRIPLWLLIPSTALTLGFFLFIAGAGLRAQFLSTKTGREAMLGQTALAILPIGPEGGRVLVEGEYWNAISDHPIPAGSCVRICSLQGLRLTVTDPTTLEEQGQR